MLPVPRKYFVTAASAEGKTELTAFDKALLAGGIGNINLLRVSSVLPPGAEYCPNLEIPPGSLVPTAYGYVCSDVPGELIAAAVGVGLSSSDFGLIMEFSGRTSRDEAAELIEKMLRESFLARGLELMETKIAAVEHRVERIGCALAAVPMYY